MPQTFPDLELKQPGTWNDAWVQTKSPNKNPLCSKGTGKGKASKDKKKKLAGKTHATTAKQHSKNLDPHCHPCHQRILGSWISTISGLQWSTQPPFLSPPPYRSSAGIGPMGSLDFLAHPTVMKPCLPTRQGGIHVTSPGHWSYHAHPQITRDTPQVSVEAELKTWTSTLMWRNEGMPTPSSAVLRSKKGT